MPEWPYLLRNGKRLIFPALFIRPSTRAEAIITYRVFSENPQETKAIAGYVCSVKDWKAMEPVLSERAPRIDLHADGLKEKIRLIDPDMQTLFTGPKNEKRELMKVRIDNQALGDISIPGLAGPVPLRRVVEAAIGEIESPMPKAQNYANRFYSHTDRMTYGFEKFQIDNDADIIIGSYVPITTTSIADRQIEKARKLMKDSLIMLDRIFPGVRQTRDFMALMAVNARIFDTEYSDDILDLAIRSGADHIGIKLLNFNDKDTARVSSVLRFVAALRKRLDELRKPSPIHLFNIMSEFAYASFCHGASSGVVPIATLPDLHFDPNNQSSPETKGRYYHPMDMSYDTYEELCSKTQMQDFAPPCDCPTCRSCQTIMQALPRWAAFRKEHFVFNKSEEMMEIRKVPAQTLNNKLEDKFARSQATSYLPYLDYMYPYPS
jgi:hypothetical protein